MWGQLGIGGTRAGKRSSRAQKMLGSSRVPAVGLPEESANSWSMPLRLALASKSDTELLEYALARVALEDDFGLKLIARQGRVPRDLDLEF